MRIVLVQAGGIGKRIGRNIPKQFIIIEGKPIIIHTLEKFQANKMVDNIYITCVEGWKSTLLDYCKQYEITKLAGIVNGGSSIYESTKRCLSVMFNTHSGETLVLIHEAVRPLITDEMITDSFMIAEKYGNAVAKVECIDEIGISIDGICTNKVVFGKNLYILQNPHTFRLDKLYYAYSNNEELGYQGTAVLMYKLGEILYYSKGHPDSFKITYPEDLRRFFSLLALYK